MNTRQELVYESIRNTLAALKHPTFATPEITPLRAKLEKAADAIKELYHSQAYNHLSRRSDSSQTERLRKDLRNRMLRVASNAVVSLEGLPGIEDDMRVPHANAKTSDLLEAAERFTRNVRPHLRTLRDNGLPANAINQLEATAKALAAKSSSTDTAIARRSRATSSLPDALRRGRKIVRALDATVRSEFADDAGAMRIWTTSVRVPRKKGRPKKKKRPATE